MDSTLPTPPSFSIEELERCERTGDYRPLLFEWYKFCGALTLFVASIQRESPCFKPIAAQHFHVLIGLLNRCARLMLSNVALSHEGRFGETTIIVDRCIYESAIKIIWLCNNPEDEKFIRYAADGLKKDIEFRSQIEHKISERGKELPIEKRMLASIARTIARAGLTEQQIRDAKRIPNLESILSAVGFEPLIYTVIQRMGSHGVHGTWTSLLVHYLEEQESDGNITLVLRDHDCSTHINPFMLVPTLVLEALGQYIEHVIDGPEAAGFVSLFDSTRREIHTIYENAIGGDWES